jgi:hypothetical protein
VPPSYPWTTWRDERLLQLELRQLGLTLEGAWLERRVEQLYEELLARGILHLPHVWLSDEWFSPTGIGGFAIPFYLAHPRLMRLERAQMLEVEGGNNAECMRIIRHEAGHALQHAFQFQRRRRWQALFGRSSAPYPKRYRPSPSSKRYVQHLRYWYAQSHPDEDFAETFAVWLRPKSDWRRRYTGWPALKKLEYVDELMAEIGAAKPLNASRAVHEPVERSRTTLAEHYAERRSRYLVHYPRIYDRDLRRLFAGHADATSPPGPRTGARGEAASAFLRRHRAAIRQLVATWSGEHQLTIDAVLGEMIGRARELRLRATGDERQLLADFAVLLTVHTMRFLYTRRREWIAL